MEWSKTLLATAVMVSAVSTQAQVRDCTEEMAAAADAVASFRMAERERNHYLQELTDLWDEMDAINAELATATNDQYRAELRRRLSEIETLMPIVNQDRSYAQQDLEHYRRIKDVANRVSIECQVERHNDLQNQGGSGNIEPDDHPGPPDDNGSGFEGGGSSGPDGSSGGGRVCLATTTLTITIDPCANTSQPSCPYTETETHCVLWSDD